MATKFIRDGALRARQIESDPVLLRDGTVPQERHDTMMSVPSEALANADPYLLSVSAMLSEWNSLNDARAYDDL